MGDGNDTYEELGQDFGDTNTIHFAGDVAPGVEISRLFVRASVRGYDDVVFSVSDPAGAVISEITVKNWIASD